MIDSIDIAQEYAVVFIDDAIARRAPVPRAGEGSRICTMCDGLVHPRRAALGYSICIHCQERREHQARQVRR